MVLRNYKILKGLALNQTYRDWSPNTVSLPNLKDMNGTEKTQLPVGESVGAGRSYYISGTNDTKLLWNGINYVVGTGATEPTINDYCLENDVTSSFSNRSIMKTLNQVGDTYSNELTFLCTGKNNTDADITLTEIGLYKQINFANSFYNTSYANMLFIRHLLNEPLTIAPNETFKITLTWIED